MNNPKIGIIGLGYVGLPLAVAFASKYEVVGFDINTKRIAELNSGLDATNELTTEQLNKVVGTSLKLTTTLEDILVCTTFIVTVPTPVTSSKSPDLTPIVKATESVSTALKKGDTVVYESTVYPGVTEEVCVPILEEKTGLKVNVDFFVGYSPERINPGDKKHTITKITKVVSGSTPQTLKDLSALYSSIIEAGIYEAPTIKTAEAAKVIENTQRDINIAFVNELAKIFNLLDINTHDVLEAAGTKWNFLPFKPGLVGGHCIGVDPYYLTHKAKKLGYHAQIINSGRSVNDSMGSYVGRAVAKKVIASGTPMKEARVLVMGATFKEDVSDIRNSKVVDVINELKSFSCHVEVVDPHANSKELFEEYGFDLVENITGTYHSVIVAVNHHEYTILDENYFTSILSQNGILVDLKGVFRNKIHNLNYWTL